MANEGLKQYVLGYIVVGCLRILEATAIVHRIPEPSSITEHCLLEVFGAECPDGHVIVMQSALYGRMRLGRCIQESSGNVGCVADVISYFDKHCSGKQACSVEMSSRSLLALSVCSDGYTPYLEVAFNCIAVIAGSIYHMCRSDGSISISGHSHPEGLISSTDVYNNRWGPRTCPWLIEAEPGQKINISMLDFGVVNDGDTDTNSISVICQKYLSLFDGSETQPPKTVCSGKQRERNIYISQSHSLEIRFVDVHGSDTPPNFLLKYSVLGCKDPETNGNILDERTIDKAVLYCGRSGKRFHLSCVGKSWDTHAGDCKDMWYFGDIFPDSWTSKQAMLIILGIGIGLGIVVGLALIVCGLKCLKRMYRRQQDPRADYPADCCPPQEQYGGAKPKEYVKEPADTGYHTYVRRKTSTLSYAQACDSETLLVGTCRKPMVSSADYARHPATAEPFGSDITYAQAYDSETLKAGTCRKPLMSPSDYARHPARVEPTNSPIAYADADDDQVYNKLG